MKNLDSTFTLLLFLFAVAISSQARADTTRPLAPVPTTHVKLTPPADPDAFTMVVGGDNRAPGHGDPMPPALDIICREIGLIHPDLVIWTGDSIEGYDDTPSEADAEYTTFLSSADRCGVPMFNSIGNHETGGVPAVKAVYEKRMGRLYGSFDYGNSHFIALDTDPLVDGKIKSGMIDPEQRAWLAADLAANKGKAANIFVFMHYYMFGPSDPDTPGSTDTAFDPPSGRDDLHKLFLANGVRAVFCGHNHINWHGVRDGIDYYIAGNAGAPLDAPPDQGGYLGYLLVNVKGTSFTATPIAAGALQERIVSGGDGAAATSVVAVDHEQAVATMLRGVSVLMSDAPKYAATASATYKGKTKVVAAQILDSEPGPKAGTRLVRVGFLMPKHRTVLMTVASVSGK